jgi:hypothetical protein
MHLTLAGYTDALILAEMNLNLVRTSATFTLAMRARGIAIGNGAIPNGLIEEALLKFDYGGLDTMSLSGTVLRHGNWKMMFWTCPLGCGDPTGLQAEIEWKPTGQGSEWYRPACVACGVQGAAR